MKDTYSLKVHVNVTNLASAMANSGTCNCRNNTVNKFKCQENEVLGEGVESIS